jgi:predicted N-acetyltransferase YhbS
MNTQTSNRLADELSIRVSTAADDEAIGELLIRSFNTQNAIKVPGVVASEKRLADLRNQAEKREHATVLVGELGGRVVGTVTLYRWGAPGNESWIENGAGLRYLAVDVNFAGQGYSRVFIDEAKKLAAQWDASAICLRVRREAEGLKRLYGLHGWGRDPAGDLDLLPEVYLHGFSLVLQPRS